MAKVKVEVIGAYVDGHGPGSIVSIEEKTAKHVEKIGYGKIIEKAEEPKAEKPKKETKKKEPKKEEKSEGSKKKSTEKKK